MNWIVEKHKILRDYLNNINLSLFIECTDRDNTEFAIHRDDNIIDAILVEQIWIGSGGYEELIDKIDTKESKEFAFINHGMFYTNDGGFPLIPEGIALSFGDDKLFNDYQIIHDPLAYIKIIK